MPQFQTPYGTVDAPSVEAAQKWIARQKGGASGDSLKWGDSLWSDIKEYAKGSLEGLKMAGRDIARDVPAFARDVGTELNPMSSPQQRAQAGGNILGKLGDVAALGSGGFAGPFVPQGPGGAAVGARPPMGVQRPAIAPPRAPDAPMKPIVRVPAQSQPGIVPLRAQRPSPTMVRQQIANADRLSSAASEATTPGLINDLARGDAIAIDRKLTRAYRTAVRPTDRSRTVGQLDARDRGVMRAVDNIIANKDAIELTDANGETRSAGRTPRSLYQFGEAIQQLKAHIFDQYDAMGDRAGGAGVRVPLEPAIKQLLNVTQNADLAATRPGIVAEAHRLAENWARMRALSPKQAQETIKTLNAALSEPAEEVLRPSVNALRESLDQSIMTSQGPGYAPLKKQYADLLGIENDVIKAAAREAKDVPGIGRKLGDLAAAEEFLRGIWFMDPKAIATSAAIKGSQMALRWLRSPNRAVARMFDHRAATLRQSAPPTLGPNGGTIIGRRSFPSAGPNGAVSF